MDLREHVAHDTREHTMDTSTDTSPEDEAIALVTPEDAGLQDALGDAFSRLTVSPLSSPPDSPAPTRPATPVPDADATMCEEPGLRSPQHLDPETSEQSTMSTDVEVMATTPADHVMSEPEAMPGDELRRSARLNAHVIEVTESPISGEPVLRRSTRLSGGPASVEQVRAGSSSRGKRGTKKGLRK